MLHQSKRPCNQIKVCGIFQYRLLTELLRHTSLGPSAADDWMDHIINEKVQRGTLTQGLEVNKDENPYEELERYFHDPVVPRRMCPEVIPWWGVSIYFHLVTGLYSIGLFFSQKSKRQTIQ